MAGGAVGQRRGVRVVMVATDFSENAQSAQRRGIELARAHGAQLILTHVLTMPPAAPGGPRAAVYPPGFEEQVREACLERLEHGVGQARDAGVEARGLLEDGSAAEQLIRVAARLEVDLFVIGTRGQTGLQHLLLGSVAEAVVREASCPVLTVHPGDRGSLAGTKRLLLPTDLTEDADHALEVAREVLGSQLDDIELTLLHVYHLPLVVAPISGVVPQLPQELIDQAREAALDALERVAARLREAGAEVTVAALHGDPATVIVDFAIQHEIGLIVMGTRGLSRMKELILGTSAKRVVQHAHCPVLTSRGPQS